MKKIISLSLACVLLALTLSLGACRKIGNKSTVTTTEPPKPIPVDTVNGMTAKDLFGKYCYDRESNPSIDLTSTYTDADEEYTQYIELKINGSELYTYIKDDIGELKIHYIDGVAYVDTGDEKYKSSHIDPEDILGYDIFGMYNSVAASDWIGWHAKKLKEAQIYSYDGLFYFDITYTAVEAHRMGNGDRGYTETLYFDSLGTLKKFVSKSAKHTTVTEVNSYGKEVHISLPADAYLYVEKDDGVGAGDQDPQIYDLYERLCTTLDDANIYTMRVEGLMVGDLVWYETDGLGHYIKTKQDGAPCDKWLIAGRQYVSLNGGDVSMTLYTEDIIFEIEMAIALKGAVAKPIHGNSMKDLTLERSEGLNILSFDATDEEGNIERYTITFDDQFSSVHINRSNVINEYSIPLVDYWFGSINDQNFKIEVVLS